MHQAGVNKELVSERLLNGAARSQALPFRYLAAARVVPGWEQMIDAAMMRSLGNVERLPGKTVLMLDHSDSMNERLSAKSDLRRADAAAGLAVLLAGICEDLECWSFSSTHSPTNYGLPSNAWKLLEQVPVRQGMAMRDAYFNSMPRWGGTELGKALRELDKGDYDRLIVITDEQSSDRVSAPKGRGYMINVASNRNGVGYGKWNHVDGFSEAVVEWIGQVENEVGQATLA
jgi:hypothetical protein